MKSTMEAIEDYIVYLKNEQKLFVTIHSCGDALTHVTGRLAPYNIHANPYCVFIKSVSDRWNECICRQSGIYEHIRTHGDEIFFGSCYAGVGEYVVPGLRRPYHLRLYQCRRLYGQFVQSTPCRRKASIAERNCR